MLNSWMNAGLVLTLLAGLMVGLRVYQRRCSPHPEVVRKLLHVPMGLLTLTFPWLFDSGLPVVMLATVAVGSLLMLRYYQPLHLRFGSVLGGVGRRSLGEIYFPIAVALLFVLVHGNALLFCIPMLILTLADAVAAVIGVRYGQIRYTTTDGQKSAEGSMAFFMVAFFSTHVPLLLVGNTGRAETLLIALILGLLVMLLEAIAWQGLDNLFIPIGGFILLRSHLSLSIADLLVRLAVTVILVGFVLCWRKRTTLNDSALLGAAFLGYLSWTLGGWRWLLPPMILLITYPLLVSWVDQQQTPLTPAEQKIMRWLPTAPGSQCRKWERIHNIYSVLSVCAAGLLWLLLFGIFDRSEFLYPYTLAFAANLAVVGVAGLSPMEYWHSSRFVMLMVYVLKSWLLMFVPLVAVVGVSQISIASTLFGLLGTALAAIAYYLTQPALRNHPTDTLSWICRALYTMLGSLLALLPLYLL
jgi:phytol kinase